MLDLFIIYHRPKKQTQKQKSHRARLVQLDRTAVRNCCHACDRPHHGRAPLVTAVMASSLTCAVF